MKILFLLANANLKGGTEILTFNLMHALNENGTRAVILSVERYEGSSDGVLSFTSEASVAISRLKENPFSKLLGSALRDCRLRKEIVRIAAEVGAEWVIAQDYDLIASLPTSAGLKIAQVFNWSVKGYEESLRHGLSSLFMPKGIISAWCQSVQRWRWHRQMPKLDKLIALSRSACNELRQICPRIRSEQLTVIPDPLMVTGLAQRCSSLGNKRVVFVGRLSQEKGVMRLLRIWERIRAVRSDYTLDIYGEGHLEKQMREFVSEHQLNGVRFCGFCSNLEAIYTNADLLLMTSETEGFGMVPIEAMHYGVPCVSFDCPTSPKEVIAEAGVVVPCFEEDAYAKEVVALLNDESRMRRLQATALRRAQQYYVGNIVKMWERALA